LFLPLTYKLAQTINKSLQELLGREKPFQDSRDFLRSSKQTIEQKKKESIRESEAIKRKQIESEFEQKKETLLQKYRPPIK
jgi:hypothetical protein